MYSNQYPIWLETTPPVPVWNWHQPFRFKAIWVGAKKCSKIIEEVWVPNGCQGSVNEVMELISKCGAKLKHWNRYSFGNIQKHLTEANETLKRALEQHPTDFNSSVLNEARKEVQVWLERDEMMLKQCSKVSWLREGDRNSRFFHVKALNRRRKNILTSSKNSDGEWVENEELTSHIISYFQSMFSAAEVRGPMDFLGSMEGWVIKAIRVDLLRAHTAEEVHCALKKMHPSKAPSPNGMLSLFFQKY